MTQDSQLSLPFVEQDSPEFFRIKRPWSASKHRIILKYLHSFAYILSSKHRRVNYVDAFAGTGSYDEGIGIENILKSSKFWSQKDAGFKDTDGSPLISLKIARVFQNEDRIIKCFFAEENKKRNEDLKRQCLDFNQDSYKIYNPQSFEKCFSDIISDLENYPTLFFLDSFGLKGLKFETIEKIAKYIRSYKGELFLLFHNRAMARNAGQSLKSEKYAKAYCEHLTNFLGKKSEVIWKEKWIQFQKDPQSFENWALQYFKDQLIRTAGFSGVYSFPIHETYDDSRPQYHMIFCSNYPEKSCGTILNELLYTEEELLYFQTLHKGNHKFLDQEWQDSLGKKYKIVRDWINTEKYRVFGQWKTVEDGITKMILEIGSLGYLKRSQYRNLITELIDSNELDVRSLGKHGRPVDKSEIRLKPTSSN